MKGMTKFAALVFAVSVIAASGVLFGAAFAKAAGQAVPGDGSMNIAPIQAATGGSANGKEPDDSASVEAVQDGGNRTDALIQTDDTSLPSIVFISPTPANGTFTTNTSVRTGINIINASSLSEFKWNWGGTNYSFYDNSLVFMMGLDNVSALGENSTYFADVSANQNNGTCSGANCPSYIPDGKYGGAYKFDGSSSYVSVPDAQPLNIPQNITVAMWANISAVQESDLIQKGYGTVTGGYTFWIGNMYGYNGINWGAQATNNWVATTAMPATNRWTYIVGTYDGTTLRIYLDGRLNNSANFSFSFSAAGPLVLGYGWDGYANSAIDEVMIWNRTLTADEISRQYVSNIKKYDTDKWQFYTSQDGLTTGDYTYYGTARSSAGENRTETRTVSVDLTTPQIQFTTPTETSGAALGRNYVQVNATSSGSNIANITVYLYNSTALVGSATATTSPNFANFTGLADITYFFNATATNLVGNSNSTSTRNVTIDATPPTVALNQPSNGAGALPQNITFNFTAYDVLSPPMNCTMYLDNAAAGSNSSTANNTLTRIGTNNITEGAHGWNVTCADGRGNRGASETRQFTVNVTPVLNNATASPNPIKGGNVLTVTATGVDDPNNDALYFYCSESSSSTPNSTNTNCTGGATTDSSPPYSLSCTYAAASDDALHQVNCRVFDGIHYSPVRTANFTTDNTAPGLSIANVAGDTAPAYYDTANDGWTNITVSGEAGMSCRWSTSDLAYGGMTNDCDTASGTQVRCGIATGVQGLNYNWYVACSDSVGNSNTADNNLDVTGAVLDWTAPTTTDNSSSGVQLPGYAVALTESDNLYGTASIVTKYCISSAACIPDTSIDNGGTVTFGTRGQNFLRYNSSDPAGNAQAIQNKSVSINRLPIFTGAADDVATISGGSTVHITTAASDADGQVIKLYICNGTSVSSNGCSDSTYCSNTTASSDPSCSFAAESDSAAHDWYAFIYDTLDEGAAANFNGSYTTDNAPPSITINSPTNTTYAEASVAVDVTLGEGGGYAWYSLDGAASTTMSNDSATHWTATLSGLTDGLHRIRIYGNDSMGNTNTTLLPFRRNSSLLDTNPPTLTVTAPSNNSYSLSNTILANISLSEVGNSSWYSLDGTANVSMDRVDNLHFGASISGLSEANHILQFYANDSSGNIGSSGMIIFYADLTPPRYTAFGIEPATPTDNQSAVCWSHWTDAVGLNSYSMNDNVTGNGTGAALSGTDVWINRTFSAAQLLPRGYSCNITVHDNAGRSNTTGLMTFIVSDATPPLVYNVSYSPTDNDTLDPNVTVSVTANVTDEGTLDSILLEYKETNASTWSQRAMQALGGGLYGGNFTPDVSDVWTFRVTANDNAGNTNSSTAIVISAELDGSWSAGGLGTVSGVINSNVTVGNLVINNTADYNQTFTITSNWGNTFFNATTVSVADHSSAAISVSATASGSVREDVVTLTITAQNGTASPSSRTTDFTLISYTNGPYLYITVNAPDSITQGGNADLNATIKNLGNSSATGTSFTWSLPGGWVITSGSQTTNIGFLGINEQASAGITVNLNSSAGTGTQTVVVQTTSDQTSNSASKSVIVLSTGGAVTTVMTGSVGSATGGGGGGTVPAAPDIRVVAPKTAEMPIESTQSIQVDVTNVYSMDITGVTLETSGFLSQYISVEPASVTIIKPGETQRFTIKVTAPAYLSEKNYPLTVTAKGRFKGAGVDIPVAKAAVINLVIRTTKQTVNASISEAEKAVADMTTAGMDTSKQTDLLGKARKAAQDGDITETRRLIGEITRLKDEAFAVDAGLKDLETKITAAEAAGHKTTESTAALDLAKEAFARGDYDKAQTRLNAALLTFAIESGKLDIIKLAVAWWWLIILSGASGSFMLAVIWREFRMWDIGRRLKALQKEERVLGEMMASAQQEYYKKGTMPKVTFYKTMYEYERRLEKVRTTITKLSSERTKMIKAVEELERLKAEDKKMTSMIAELQKVYFVEAKISKEVYTKRLKAYARRRSEIAQAAEAEKMQMIKEEKSAVERFKKRTTGVFSRLLSRMEKTAGRGGK